IDECGEHGKTPFILGAMNTRNRRNRRREREQRQAALPARGAFFASPPNGFFRVGKEQAKTIPSSGTLDRGLLGVKAPWNSNSCPPDGSNRPTRHPGESK